MNTLHNITLEIETSWDTRLTKRILETRYVNGVCMYVRMYVWITFRDAKYLLGALKIWEH